MRRWVPTLFLLVAACGGSRAPAPTPAGAGTPIPLAGGPPQVTYRLGEDRVFRLRVVKDAEPEDVSAALDRVTARAEDRWLNVSPDGRVILFETRRFGCADWACLAISPSDLSAPELVKVGEDVVHPYGFSAVAPRGSAIVYSERGEDDRIDLYVLDRVPGGWAPRRGITSRTSPFTINDGPAISADGGRIVFNCGDEFETTAICEIGIDGRGYRVVARPRDHPPGASPGPLRHADYAPDGTIVTEASWTGERIWRLGRREADPVLLSRVSNDNSPCVLPDGRIVSLWLNRPGGRGLHEMKVVDPDGRNQKMLLTDVDVADVGIGCGA